MWSDADFYIAFSIFIALSVGYWLYQYVRDEDKSDSRALHPTLNLDSDEDSS